MKNFEETSSILAKNIINLRKMRGLTQGRLSELADIPRTTITYFESGSCNPSLQNMLKIAGALEVKVEELLAESVSNATLVKAKNLTNKQKNTSNIINLLPHPLTGLTLELFEMPIDGSFTGIPHLKGSTEYFTCITGKIEVAVTGSSYVLEEGDVLYFQGDETHSYKNLSSNESFAISAIYLREN